LIISRTPYRLSFFGGGTDYPEWYLQHGGAVLSTTIDKYCYLMCRNLPPFFEHKYAIRYSKIESVKEIDEIKHPTAREILRFLNISHGLEINHEGDLPARSGMGSSSAFTVGLLSAIHSLKGKMISKEQLYKEAIHIEQNVIKETVGSQDQVASACGGLNKINFLSNGEIIVTPIIIPQERMNILDSHMMLFYTGFIRTASNVAKSYVDDITSRKRQLRIMKDLVDEAVNILGSGTNINDFGHLLHENWQIKRSLSEQVSNSDIDDIYKLALSAGAIGGKLSGAGAGGFMMLFVPPENRIKVLKKLDKLINVPFRFDFSGTQIIFHDPEKDYSDLERKRKKQNISSFKEIDGLNDQIEMIH
jgi:D-glycero-alpha-D-manno-heptose-7-phosphate kinase